MSRLWKTVCGGATVETKRQRHHRIGKLIVIGENPLSRNSQNSRCVSKLAPKLCEQILSSKHVEQQAEVVPKAIMEADGSNG